MLQSRSRFLVGILSVFGIIISGGCFTPFGQALDVKNPFLRTFWRVVLMIPYFLIASILELKYSAKDYPIYKFVKSYHCQTDLMKAGVALSLAQAV
jgi:hypothetical protein